MAFTVQQDLHQHQFVLETHRLDRVSGAVLVTHLLSVSRANVECRSISTILSTCLHLQYQWSHHCNRVRVYRNRRIRETSQRTNNLSTSGYISRPAVSARYLSTHPRSTCETCRLHSGISRWPAQTRPQRWRRMEPEIRTEKQWQRWNKDCSPLQSASVSVLLLRSSYVPWTLCCSGVFGANYRHRGKQRNPSTKSTWMLGSTVNDLLKSH